MPYVGRTHVGRHVDFRPVGGNGGRNPWRGCAGRIHRKTSRRGAGESLRGAADRHVYVDHHQRLEWPRDWGALLLNAASPVAKHGSTQFTDGVMQKEVGGGCSWWIAPAKVPLASPSEGAQGTILHRVCARMTNARR